MSLLNKSNKGGGFKRLKEETKLLLGQNRLEEIISLASKNHNILRALYSMLFDSDRLICYRAAVMLSRALVVYRSNDPELIIEYFRRLFWSMNDESGNLCRFAPEAIGEILFKMPHLIDEYGSNLASFLNEEPFEVGVRTAIARIAEKNKKPFAQIDNLLLDSLLNKNPNIKGASLLALAALSIKIPNELLHRMSDDKELFEYYDYESSDIVVISTGEMAQKIKTGGEK